MENARATRAKTVILQWFTEREICGTLFCLLMWTAGGVLCKSMGGYLIIECVYERWCWEIRSQYLFFFIWKLDEPYELAWITFKVPTLEGTWKWRTNVHAKHTRLIRLENSVRKFLQCMVKSFDCASRVWYHLWVSQAWALIRFQTCLEWSDSVFWILGLLWRLQIFS